MLRQKEDEVFMTSYVEVIIEFMYNQFRNKIMQVLLPGYLLQLSSIQAIVIISDKVRDHMLIHGDEGIDDLNALVDLRKIALVCCLFVNILNLVIFIRSTIHIGHRMLYRFTSWMDLIIILAVFYICQQLLFELNQTFLRCVEAVLIVFIWFKSIYFLRLIDEIAPLVDMISIIINDIKYFVAIFIIAIIAFSQGFMLIGKNQIQEGYDPPYANIVGAIEHVYLSSLGEFDTEAYTESEMMTPILFILFLGLSFYMQIVLLNMLIAIMGDTFNRINEIRESKKKQSQLLFIVDNWYINPIKEKEKIVYIIAAC